MVHNTPGLVILSSIQVNQFNQSLVWIVSTVVVVVVVLVVYSEDYGVFYFLLILLFSFRGLWKAHWFCCAHCFFLSSVHSEDYDKLEFPLIFTNNSLADPTLETDSMVTFRWDNDDDDNDDDGDADDDDNDDNGDDDDDEN